jgi:hypothetical protein
VPHFDGVILKWGMPPMCRTGDPNHELSGSRPTRYLSKLCPNNWLPFRPAESRLFSEHSLAGHLTRTEWYWSGRGGRRRKANQAHLPDNP